MAIAAWKAETEASRGRVRERDILRTNWGRDADRIEAVIEPLCWLVIRLEPSHRARRNAAAIASIPLMTTTYRRSPAVDHHELPIWRKRTRKKEMPRAKLQDEEVRFQEVPTISHCLMKPD